MKLSSPIGLIKKSFGIFFEKKSLVYFLKVYAILLPFSLLTFFEEKVVADPAEVFGRYLWLIPAALIFVLAYLLVGFWVSASGIFAVAAVVGGDTLSVKKTFLSSWKVLWGFSLLQIVVGFLVGLGFILLIIPGIILMVWFHFAAFGFITKKLGVKESVLASKKLVSGNFWEVLGRIFVFGLFTTFSQILLSIVPFGIGSALFPMFGALFMLPSYLLYKELLASES